MTFKMPEKLDGLSIDELDALHGDALAAAKELAKLPEDELTDEQIDELDSITSHVDTIKAARASLEQAARERAERIAAAKSKIEAAEAKPEDEREPEPEPDEEPEAEPAAEPVEEPETPETPEGDEPEVPNPEQDAIPGEPADPTEKEKEPVSGRRSVSKVASEATPIEDAIDEPLAAQATIVAAADVPGVPAKSTLDTMSDVASAFLARMRGFSSGKTDGFGDSPIGVGVKALSEKAQRYGVAQIEKPENEFSTSMNAPLEEQYETLVAAAKESRLPGGSLTAAGGWCAPSETLYDSFAALEDGSAALFSLPEVGAKRGGIRFTRGPQLGDLQNADGSFGFIQTEAQAEAGQVKTLISLECPPFEEVRMDAVGYGLTVPILTNKAYPELVRRYIQLAATAHRLRMNADRISRVMNLIGTPIDHAEIGAATSDILDALVIQATRLRFQYTMDPEATIEVVAPFWAKELIRADLSRRTGVDLLNVTDAQINTYFTTRNLAVQWIRGYQDWSATSTGTWTAFPTTLEFALYPAGTFVALTEDVISLDGVYDTDGLTHNTFTGVFFEEGTAVASMSGSGVRVTLSVTPYGLSGAASVGPAAPAA